VRAALEQRGVEDADRLRRDQAPQAFADLQDLLKRFPDELYVHLQLQDLVKSVYAQKLQELSEQYRRSMEARPKSAAQRYLYGRILGWDRQEEAARYYEQALELEPDFARAHLALTYVYTATASRDPLKAEAHLQAFLRLCPESVEGYGYLGSIQDAGFKRAAARDLRSLLETRRGSAPAGLYPILWRLELALAAPAELVAARKRIEADLAALRSLARSSDRDGLRALVLGSEMTDDPKGAAQAAEQLLERFPAWPETRRIVLRRWQEAHPFPKDGGAAAVQAYAQELLHISEDWVRRWPRDPVSWLRRAEAVRRLPEVPAEEAVRTAEGLLAAWEADPEEVQTYPETVPMKAAQVYLSRKLQLDRVPELAERGIAVAEEHARRFLASPGLTPEERGRAALEVEASLWSGWAIVFDAWAELGRKEQAREALGKLKGLLDKGLAEPALDEPAQAERRAGYWARLGRLAELEGRKLDALVFSQSALVLGLEHGLAAEGLQPLQERIRRLWQELGGTPQGWADKQKSETARRKGSEGVRE
jgi:tetratricopeptide (TPR) repeat protein